MNTSIIETIKRRLPHSLERPLKRGLSWYRIYLARQRGVCAHVYPQQGKLRVLFYDVRGLTYGGTQKSFQLIAKYLNKDKYEVYYMYSSSMGLERLAYMRDAGVVLIPFTHGFIGSNFPYYIPDMVPHIFDVLEKYKINLIVSPGSGYPEYPLAAVTRVPIVHINIFGSINTQPNIRLYLCISNYLTTRVQRTLPARRVETFYLQSEGPDVEAGKRGRQLRMSLGIQPTDFVFGRIGRPDDAIFDPIGLLAFAQIVKMYPQAHYIIVAPANRAKELVQESLIPNVHFLSPTGDEAAIWAFHSAIDVLAHFRYDGETMGLNIAESMLCGKPVVTHVSRYWNAHLEYLDSSCAFVAAQDNVEEYKNALQKFLGLEGRALAARMGLVARKKAEKLFLIQNNITRFEQFCSTSSIKTLTYVHH